MGQLLYTYIYGNTHLEERFAGSRLFSQENLIPGGRKRGQGGENRRVVNSGIQRNKKVVEFKLDPKGANGNAVRRDAFRSRARHFI